MLFRNGNDIMISKIRIKAKAVVRYKNTISMLKCLLVSVVVLSGCGIGGSDPSRSSVDPRPVGPARSAQSAIKGFSSRIKAHARG